MSNSDNEFSYHLMNLTKALCVVSPCSVGVTITLPFTVSRNMRFVSDNGFVLVLTQE